MTVNMTVTKWFEQDLRKVETNKNNDISNILWDTKQSLIDVLLKSKESMLIIDESWMITDINEWFADIIWFDTSNKAIETIKWKLLLSLINSEDNIDIQELDWLITEKYNTVRFSIINSKENTKIPVEASFTPIDIDWKLHFYSIVRNISTYKKEIQKVRLQWQKDQLTWLYNRYFYDDFMKKSLKSTLRNWIPLSLLFLDMDYFKQVNDRYGHDAWDIVLKELAIILLANTRWDDIAARLWWEEFAIVLVGVDENWAKVVAEKIRQSVEKKIFNVNNSTHLKWKTISIWIAQFFHNDILKKDIHQKEEEYQHILQMQADDALYFAKDTGRNQFKTFNDVARNTLTWFQLEHFDEIYNTTICSNISDTRVDIGKLDKNKKLLYESQYKQYCELIKEVITIIEKRKKENMENNLITTQIPKNWTSEKYDPETDESDFKISMSYLTKYIDQCIIMENSNKEYEMIIHSLYDKITDGSVDEIIDEISIVFDKIFMLKYTMDSQYLCQTKRILSDIFSILSEYNAKHNNEYDYKKIKFVTSTYIYGFISNLWNYNHFDQRFFKWEEWLQENWEKRIDSWLAKFEYFNLNMIQKEKLIKHVSVIAFDSIIEFFEQNQDNSIYISIFNDTIYSLINKIFNLSSIFDKSDNKATDIQVMKLRYRNSIMSYSNHLNFIVASMFMLNDNELSVDKFKTKILSHFILNTKQYIEKVQQVVLCISKEKKNAINIKTYSITITNLILLKEYMELLKLYIDCKDNELDQLSSSIVSINILLKEILTKELYDSYEKDKNVIISDFLNENIWIEIKEWLHTNKPWVDFNKNSIRWFFLISQQRLQLLKNDCDALKNDDTLKIELQKIILNFYHFSKVLPIKKTSNIIKYALIKKKELDIVDPIAKNYNIEKLNIDLLNHSQSSLFSKTYEDAIGLLRWYLSTIVETKTAKNIKFKIINSWWENDSSISFEDMWLSTNSNDVFSGLEESIKKWCIWWHIEWEPQKYPIELIQNKSLQGIKWYNIKLWISKECLIVPFKYSNIKWFINNWYLVVVSDFYENIWEKYKLEENYHILQSLLLVMDEYNKRLNIVNSYEKAYNLLKKDNLPILYHSNRLWTLSNIVYDCIQNSPLENWFLDEINDTKKKIWLNTNDLIKTYCIFHDIGWKDIFGNKNFVEWTDYWFFENLIFKLVDYLEISLGKKVSENDMIKISEAFQQIDNDKKSKDLTYDIKTDIEKDNSINFIQKAIELASSYDARQMENIMLWDKKLKLNLNELQFINIYNVYNKLVNYNSKKCVHCSNLLQFRLKNIIDVDKIMKEINILLSKYNLWEKIEQDMVFNFVLAIFLYFNIERKFMSENLQKDCISNGLSYINNMHMSFFIPAMLHHLHTTKGEIEKVVWIWWLNIFSEKKYKALTTISSDDIIPNDCRPSISKILLVVDYIDNLINADIKSIKKSKIDSIYLNQQLDKTYQILSAQENKNYVDIYLLDLLFRDTNTREKIINYYLWSKEEIAYIKQ